MENETISQIFPLFRLLVNILLVAHVVAVLWVFTAKLEIYFYDENQTWLHLNNFIEAKSFYSTYIHSVYWAVSTMATILLYIPQTDVEIIFSIIAIFVCGGVFGYALNTIGNILNDIGRKSFQFRQEREKINRFLISNQIPPILRERVQLYLDYIQQQSKEKNVEEEAFVYNILSKSLKDQILQHKYQDTIKEFSIIYNNFSYQTIQQCMLIIQEEVYSPDTLIFQENEYFNDSIYLIKSGKIEFCYVIGGKQTKKVIKTLQSGEVFGEKEFFTGQCRYIQCISQEPTTVCKIDRLDFKQIILENKDDFEKYEMIKSDIYQNLQSPFYSNICEICNQKGHDVRSCNIVQFIPNIKALIYDYSHLDTQIRSSFNRRQDSYATRLNLYTTQNERQYIFDSFNIDSELLYIVNQYKNLYQELWQQSSFYEETQESDISDEEQIDKIYKNHHKQGIQVSQNLQNKYLKNVIEEEEDIYKSEEDSQNDTNTDKSSIANNNSHKKIQFKNTQQNSVDISQSVNIKHNKNNLQNSVIQNSQIKQLSAQQKYVKQYTSARTRKTSMGKQITTSDSSSYSSEEDTKQKNQKQQVNNNTIYTNNHKQINNRRNSTYWAKQMAFQKGNNEKNILQINQQQNRKKSILLDMQINIKQLTNQDNNNHNIQKKATRKIKQQKMTMFKQSSLFKEQKSEDEMINNTLQQLKQNQDHLLDLIKQQQQQQQQSQQQQFQVGSEKIIQQQNSNNRRQSMLGLIDQFQGINKNNSSSNNNNAIQKTQPIIEDKQISKPISNLVKDLNEEEFDIEWDLQNVDKMKNYKIYYPKNNISFIIQNLNKKNYQINSQNDSLDISKHQQSNLNYDEQVANISSNKNANRVSNIAILEKFNQVQQQLISNNQQASPQKSFKEKINEFQKQNSQYDE